MVVPELEECPNCGNEDIYCYSHCLDVHDIEKYCTECETEFNLGEAIYG